MRPSPGQEESSIWLQAPTPGTAHPRMHRLGRPPAKAASHSACLLSTNASASPDGEMRGKRPAPSYATVRDPKSMTQNDSRDPTTSRPPVADIRSVWTSSRLNLVTSAVTSRSTLPVAGLRTMRRRSAPPFLTAMSARWAAPDDPAAPRIHRRTSASSRSEDSPRQRRPAAPLLSSCTLRTPRRVTPPHPTRRLGDRAYRRACRRQ